MSKPAPTAQAVSHPKSYPCPQCQKLTVWQDNPYKPFCSDRCKLIDLGAWANEDYKLPAQDSPFSQDLE
ncbi:DNA gyrase inhibitor YacG [Psychrobacter sp. H7-1]|uniref:DNA gyrase inhibitor YacG n=1 Tax=Psychrobacter sp. H7-1 TaxID=1569265 RepID=UPI00191B186F|nr:DNA gyrase inhibitor YacG [Psychrobacter sp. H7-1]